MTEGERGEGDTAGDELEGVVIRLTKEDVMLIELLRREEESVLDVVRRALSESLEYSILRKAFSSLDGGRAQGERAEKYVPKLEPGKPRNTLRDVVMEERKNLKEALESKWAEVGDG
ncbi:hypothetical protein GCM10007108_08270 [Thermogymnomonas acidicola]|uniref:Uncharacterized protein n=1 Tax=Thermogymnomonas acidicola TaxID=399579 RepID=A0AA37BR44_9ARCH|nr:hypothetical protein [Thermogymnomonas acidicola]GGM72461.1 hypothetical protein GCM10007108_08270 [Thermogymnomonas acidicola]